MDQAPLPERLKQLRIEDLRLLYRSYLGDTVQPKQEEQLGNAKDAIRSVRSDPESDQRLKQAITELITTFDEIAGLPLIWMIGGSPTMLQEFIMPILYQLQEDVSEKSFRSIELRSADFGFRKDELYQGLNDGTIKFSISNGKGLDYKNSDPGKKTPYHMFDFDPIHESIILRAKQDSISSEDKEIDPVRTKKKRSNSLLARVDIGPFDYKLYMREEVFQEHEKMRAKDSNWWRQLPLILANHHCPCGLRSLEEIADSLKAKIAHLCPTIACAAAAVKGHGSKYASILPSYLTEVEGLNSYGIDAIYERTKKKIAYPINELKDHFISVRWKPNEVPMKAGTVDLGRSEGKFLIRLLRHIHASLQMEKQS